MRLASARLEWLEGAFPALFVRNFLLFFIGQGVSLTGTWMRRLVVGWLVYEMTGSKWEVGVVGALSLFPMFFLAPFAGAVADRVDKRRLILFSQAVPAAASLLLAGLLFSGALELWHIKALVLLQGAAFALEVPARQAFVVEMVGRDKLRNAIALNSALVNLSRIIGPGIAGFVMWAFSYAAVFALDALSYIAVIATLLALRLPKFKAEPRTVGVLAHLAGGAREVVRNRPVRLTMSLLFLTGVFGWSYNTVMPAIGQDIFHLTEWGFGVLMSMFGIGAVAGALVVAKRHKDDSCEGQMFLGLGLMGAGLLAMAASPTAVAMGAASILAGFGGVMFVSTGNTLVQLSVADSVRGRVMGIWALGFGGSLPLGALVFGKTAEWMDSPQGTIAVYAVAMLACGAAAWALNRSWARSEAAQVEALAAERAA